MVQIEQLDRMFVVQLGPEYSSLDDDAVNRLQAQLLKLAESADPPWMLIDLSHTKFVGSLFLAMLVRCNNRLTNRHGRLGLCAVGSFCRDALRISRLDRIWPIFLSREDAQTRFGPYQTSPNQTSPDQSRPDEA